MPLASCPKCGYALPTGSNHCRHCKAVFLKVPRRKVLDAGMVMRRSAAVLAAIYLYGGIFGGKHHPPYATLAKSTERAHGPVHPMLASR